MPDPLPNISHHLAVGEGWVLSAGADAATGELRLVVRVADGDVPALRRCLAVAGSVGGRHLASVVDVVAQPDRSAVVVLVRPLGPCLAEVAECRAMTAGGVVTLVAPLARLLAVLHARGLSLGPVERESVWLAEDGCPMLVPLLLRERSEGVAVAGGRAESAGDVGALAATALSVLDRTSPGATGLAACLTQAVDGGLDAVGLADAVLRVAAAAPIGTPACVASAARLSAPRPVRSAASVIAAARRARGRRRAPRARTGRPMAAVAAVALVATALGGWWGRHGGGSVLAAPLPPRAGDPVARPTGADGWRSIMAGLEQARARAYATGDPSLLDAVYAKGSSTGAADRRLLGRLVGNGEHTAGLRAFVESVRVVTSTDTRVTLEVTDALTAYDVLAPDGHVVRRGHGRPARRWTMTLVETTAGWRLWSVSPDRAGARSSG